MKMVRDKTGRFLERPYYAERELDDECEKIICDFLRKLHGVAAFPVATGDLEKLIERDADDLDLYADLSKEGESVEGVTDFRPGAKPKVRISKSLSEDPQRENRLRTTLTHEYTHVRLHGFLWEFARSGNGLFEKPAGLPPIQCKRENILHASEADWMEWQAGYGCGALLMPRSHVIKLVQEFRMAEHIPRMIRDGTTDSADLIAAVAERFKVSVDAARVRLLKLGSLADRNAPRSLFEN